MLKREVERLLADPSLGQTVLLPNHLQRFRRLSESTRLLEAFLLPFLERYNEDDRKLTLLCAQLCKQIGWPLDPPLVTAFSSQYYWTIAPLNLIAASALESSSLLGIPDLCHEMGQVLGGKDEKTLVGGFVANLASYINAEKAHVINAQRPQEYLLLYDILFAEWRDHWLREFYSDAVATFIAGPAFAWQHLRLSASRSRNIYHPSFGEAGEHPSDEARFRAIAEVLKLEGFDPTSIEEQWKNYVITTLEVPPAEYGLAYPDSLLRDLASCAVEGCRKFGIRPFSQSGSYPQTDVPALLIEAWRKFEEDPDRVPRVGGEEAGHSLD